MGWYENLDGLGNFGEERTIDSEIGFGRIVRSADFDGDGFVELGYIDRPHLAKTLRLWRFKDGKLIEIATKTGLTNHKIGWDFIAGGLRNCADTPEMITADASWSRIIATAYDGTSLSARDIGPYAGPQSLTKALSCP